MHCKLGERDLLLGRLDRNCPIDSEDASALSGLLQESEQRQQHGVSRHDSEKDAPGVPLHTERLIFCIISAMQLNWPGQVQSVKHTPPFFSLK